MKYIILLLLVPFFLYSRNYSTCNECVEFINYMHKRYGFNKEYLHNLFANVKHQQTTLERYNGTLKNATDYSWRRYKSKILIPQSIELGREFMQKYATSLKRAKELYGIDKEIITSFIRVESKFGLYGNEYRVLDSLVTLSFNPNRKKRFFKNELEKFLILTKRAHINPLKVKGSFAGAMGCVQQMPSIYLRYGVDLNQDGKKDPNSMSDCIGSIAKFLKYNGWKNYRETIIKPTIKGSSYKNLRSRVLSKYSYNTLKKFGIYPPYRGSFYYIKLYNGNGYDIFLGDNNYKVITRYNHSKQYATSIGLYYKALKAK